MSQPLSDGHMQSGSEWLSVALTEKLRAFGNITSEHRGGKSEIDVGLRSLVSGL